MKKYDYKVIGIDTRVGITVIGGEKCLTYVGLVNLIPEKREAALVNLAAVLGKPLDHLTWGDVAMAIWDFDGQVVDSGIYIKCADIPVEIPEDVSPGVCIPVIECSNIAESEGASV